MDNTIPITFPTDWIDYELIDSGEGAKLERFGDYTISRPDPRAIWLRHASQEVWQNADAQYIRSSKESGDWKIVREPPIDWHLTYNGLKFNLKPTSFKHVGVFPEQAVNWDWIGNKLKASNQKRVLNLFAYTGGATLASAKAEATVTHVDSSQSSIHWAKENAAASGLSQSPIRWILDDVSKFVNREIRRGNTYDAIILDPPRFGRGTKGEVWKLDDNLTSLLTLCKQLISNNPLFIILNAYTADLSSIALDNTLRDVMNDGIVETMELTIKDTTSERLLPHGIISRWTPAP